MRYSTPYNDRITLPHIKKINSIGINTDNLFYDSRELSGQVIIDGEYLTDNDEDIMSFTHDLPVSILIDDADIEPEIHISNFKYELIPGVGLEIMFELDMVLTEKVHEEPEKEEMLNQRIEELDQQLAQNNQQLESLTNSSEMNEVKRVEETPKVDKDVIEFKKQIDQNLEKLIGDRKSSKKNKAKKEEKPIEPVVEVKQEEKPIEPVVEERDDENQVLPVDVVETELVEEKVNEIIEDVLEEAKEIEVLSKQEVVKAEVNQLSAKLQATSSSFDTGFISSSKDRYTTYKILLLEENENADEVLERKNLSRALVCDEYQSDSSKVILKIENDDN